MHSITAPRGLGIGAFSRRTGASIDTIRYYERIGLIAPPPRTRGGHRNYGQEDVTRLGFIRRARNLGFGLDEIRRLLALAENRAQSCAEARQIAAAQLAMIKTRQTELARLETILTETLHACDEQCCASPAPPCPVFEFANA